MTIKVVDASAVGALLFGEPDGEAIAGRLAGGRLVSPTLLPFEVANIALKRIRRHRELRVSLMAAFAMFERMEVELIVIDHQAAVQLAESTGLTAYDASYLWLALFIEAELITLDAALDAACAQVARQP